jgi:ABC-type dipeptide/oligopeptide/nickel transport system permease component
MSTGWRQRLGKDGYGRRRRARHPEAQGVLRGDWGISLVNRLPVTEVIGERLPNTLLLMLVAEVVVITAALLIGIYSALHQYTAAG